MKMAETLSKEDTTLKSIGASRSQNNLDKYSRKERKKYGADKPVHDEGDDAIASHRKYIFLVHSRLGQEEWRTTMEDNLNY